MISGMDPEAIGLQVVSNLVAAYDHKHDLRRTVEQIIGRRLDLYTMTMREIDRDIEKHRRVSAERREAARDRVVSRLAESTRSIVTHPNSVIGKIGKWVEEELGVKI